MTKLNEYNKKRNFKNTNEPVGKLEKKRKKLRFVVQYHEATRKHYDFRLEYNGVMLSWAIPKGQTYDTSIKRLAIRVENHPLSYRNFEGIIPKGNYGAGTVMLWDRGYFIPKKVFKNNANSYEFTLYGKRLKGSWKLLKYKDNNWFLIKEKDNVKTFDNILEYNTSIKSNKTIDEIKNKEIIKLSSPNKIMYKNSKITKKDIFNYYEKVSNLMLPYIKNRIISTVRCPDGVDNKIFFKKHFNENKRLKKYKNYNYIDNTKGLISEVQMNSIEFHIGMSKTIDIKHPNLMVFDLDPDEKLSIDKTRKCVKDLKNILDELKLDSYLKTSGGKGYHVFVPIKEKITWNKLHDISESIAKLMVEKWPDKYTVNIRKKNRTGKIFIDYFRNGETASIVAPYSLRARKKLSISMPIKWSDLDIIKPDEIDINKALKMIKRKNPWENFYN